MALTKINANVIANNTIAVGNIADNSVDATKIASNSILTRHIDDAQVTGDQLADNISIAGTFTNTGDIVIDQNSTDAGQNYLYFLNDTNRKAYVGADFGTSSGGNATELVFGTNAASAAATEAMRIDSDGKVGIGTDNPSSMLHLFAEGTDTNIRIQSTATADNTSSITFDSRLADNSNKQAFIKAYRGNLSITGDSGYGNLGIGVTAPTSIFDVRGSTDANIQSKLINPSQTTAGREAEFLFGKDNGANLSAVLKYYYHTTQASRRIDLFHYGTTNGLSILDDGKFGIGVTPTHHFNLQGTGTVEARFRSSDGDMSLQISSDADETHNSELNFMSGTSGRGSIVYDHNTTANQQKMIFKTGDIGVDAMTITGNGNVGMGTTSVPINDSGGTQPLYLTMHRDAGNLIELSADHAASGELIGGIDFTNDNNADAANNDADGKLVALMRARSYTDDSNASDDSGGILQFATKEHGNVLAERLKINQTGEVQIKGQYNSSGNSQFAYKTVFYQFDMDSGGTHYLQVPLYSSYSSSNSGGWAEMDLAWLPDHASHAHLHSYKFMWGSDHTRVLNLGVISATANETASSYGPYNITSKSELFRHPTAGENNMTYLYIKMQGYHSVNKRRVITVRGVASAGDIASIGPVIDHGSTEPVANMVSVNAEIESA